MSDEKKNVDMLSSLRSWVKRVPSDEQKGWRVGHEGRDAMYYEELHTGEWRRLDIDGEMLTGPAHHVIYFGSRAVWGGRPDWARHRRDEIIARIKSAFPIPDYEYEGEGVLDESDLDSLIKVAGGLSSEECGWNSCKEFALKGKLFCVLHANRNATLRERGAAP